MAIGILSALDGIQGEARPDDNSVVPPIDRLASLPQALIMQMAQKGQIPKSMVAPVLAKKAENAQMGMQMQAAMQKAQAGAVPPSTVIEKVIAQNAAQEAAPAMDRSNVGIASAPMRPDMYRRGMAGGGIVAFSGEQGSFIGNLADRIFGDSLAQYGESIDRTGALRRKRMYEERYGPDAVNFVEYNDALRELGLDTESESELGKGTLPLRIPDEGPIPVDIRGMGEGVFPEKEEKTSDPVLDKVREAFSRSPSEVNVTDDEVPFQTPTLKDTGLDNTAVDKKDSGVDKLVDDALKGIEDDRKPESSDYADFAKKASKLSGEELAMLGLEFGLNLMGTKEQDFLTAAGQAGKPALKTALARQAERRKEARESKMMDKKFKNQRALLQDEIESRKEIAGLDRASRELIAATKLKEVLARLDLSEKNADKALLQTFVKDIANDGEYMRDQLNLRVEQDPDERKKIIARMDRRAQEIVISRMRIFGSFGVGNTSGGGSGSGRDYKKEGFSGRQTGN